MRWSLQRETSSKLNKAAHQLEGDDNNKKTIPSDQMDVMTLNKNEELELSTDEELSDDLAVEDNAVEIKNMIVMEVFVITSEPPKIVRVRYMVKEIEKTKYVDNEFFAWTPLISYFWCPLEKDNARMQDKPS